MEELIMYQEMDKFCITRKRNIRKVDSQELILELSHAKDQLKQLEEQVKEFTRDIDKMEEYLPVAKNIREKEIAKSKEDRDNT